MGYIGLNLSSTPPAPPSQGEVRLQVGIVTAVVTIAVALLVRFAFGAPLVPELMADFIFAIVPIALVEFAVTLLGAFAKHLAFIGCLALYSIGLAAWCAGGLRFFSPLNARRIGWITLALWAATLIVVIPLLGGGLFGRELKQGAIVTIAWMAVVHSAFGLTFGFFHQLYVANPKPGSWLARAGTTWLGRRRVVAAIGYAVVGAGAYDILRPFVLSWRQSRSGFVSGGDGNFPNIDGLSREVTPTEDFYKVSKNPFDPEVEVRKWRLEVTGLVETRLALTLDDIRAMPAIEQYATLECISNEVGGDLIGNALWRGVRLRDVLSRAGLKPGIVDIALTGTDNYSDSIPLEPAMADGTILVYEMNGTPLTAAHGFPVRLIVPGIYGMKNVKWITRIEAMKYDYKGFWRVRGWDDRAPYQTMSRIDVPRRSVRGRTIIAGIAFAGDRGISKVEVSTDGGGTWELAEVKAPLSLYTWVLWHKEWTPTRAGGHSIVVRATDGKGVVQTEEVAPPIPSGATGYDHQAVKSE